MGVLMLITLAALVGTKHYALANSTATTDSSPFDDVINATNNEPDYDYYLYDPSGRIESVIAGRMECCNATLEQTCGADGQSRCDAEYLGCHCYTYCPEVELDDVTFEAWGVSFFCAYGMAPIERDVNLFIPCYQSLYERYHHEYRLNASQYISFCVYDTYYMPDETISTAIDESREEHQVARERLGTYVVMAIYVVAIPVGAIGNILVILSVYYYMRNSSVTNLLIGNIAICDLFVNLIATPIEICYVLDEIEWINRKPYICHPYLLVKVGSYVVSILFMLAMAMDRYVVIILPMKSKSLLTPGVIRVTIVLCWFLGLCLALPVHFLVGYYRCTTSDYDHPWTDLLHFYYLIVLYIIPILIIGFLYGRITRVLLQSIKMAQQMTGDKNDAKETSQARLNVVRMLIIAYIAFIVLWGPNFIFNVINVRHTEYLLLHGDFGLLTQDLMQRLVIAFTMFSSSVNPILYGIFSSQFRNTYAHIVTCGRVPLDSAGGGGKSSSAPTASTSVTRA